MHIFYIALILVSIPFTAASQGINAGFVEGVWYSEQEFFAGDSVEVSVAFRNSTTEAMEITIEFYANEEFIGDDAMTLNAGQLVAASTDWTPEVGEHEITAFLNELSFDGATTSSSTAVAASALASDVVVIDADTDGDNIGNTEDEDDDNDGISDADEIANGTDPLIFDEPEVTASTTEEEVGADTNTDSDTTVERTDQSNANESQGLEQFFNDGAVNNTLSSITGVVNDARTSLDEYRRIRSAELEAEKTQTPQEASTSSTTGGEAAATITRYQLEDDSPGVWGTIAAVLGSVLGTLYTILLAFLSFTLGYPALVQILLLIILLIVLYRLARRLGGRRPE